MAEKTTSFESSLARLGEIVSHLERGDMPLEQSLSLFEEGTALIRSCTELLDKAEQQVAVLKKGENGEAVELPFEDEK